MTSSTSFSFSPFSEAVLIVSDIRKTLAFYESFVGWHCISGIQQDAFQASVWNLPESARVESCLVREANAHSGGIRLVQVDGVEQQYIRPNAQIWDTGGIYDLNCRVTNIFELARQLHRYQWFAGAEPVIMEFGGNKVYEWLVKGHDGVVFALIERIHPPLETAGGEAKFSPVFNSSVVVTDYDAEVAFYRDTLDFTQLVQQHDTFKNAGPNVFALPLNMANKTPYQLSMFAPQGHTLGGVEICHFPELMGNDFSQRAHPPNIGIVGLRFPVTGLEILKTRLLSHQITILGDNIGEVAGIGNVRLLTARTPNNNWIEFFEHQ